MISYEDAIKIRDIIHSDNRDELIQTLLSEYARQGIDKCKFLIRLIPSITETQLSIEHDKVTRYSQGVEALLLDRNVNGRKKRKRDDTSFDFVSHLDTCYAHLNHCRTDWMSRSEKDYFNEFIDIVKNKSSNFDYENPDDLKWLESIDKERAEWFKRFVTLFIREGTE